MFFDLASGLVAMLCVSAAALVVQTGLEFTYAKLKGQPTGSSLRLAIFALSYLYAFPYFSYLLTARAKIDYPAVRDSFCKFHVQWVNLATHAVGVPLMVYGMLCMLDAAVPGGSRMFALLYLAMLKMHLTMMEWLESVIAMAILSGAATALPLGWYGVCFGMLNECATSVSHDLFEPAYFTEYEHKPWRNFLHCVLEHDFFLLPLCIAACQRQMFPATARAIEKIR
eukprot:TRINITY_DN36372_c0_g2_i2.p1 TRINITY_DN36372_c0_g2~~TRINITY_DN36372_c0_g2_i2.p1  ORF type:complete len:226 (+),score=33.65 TRINITY_DN36372_c0_g2_i2:76-753(+)